jgi:hypothetical protein
MKKLLPLLLGALLFACNSEKDVEPGNTPTFMRYYGSENSHTAVMAIEADGGYTLLSNVEVPTAVPGKFEYNIRVIHTDLNGNSIWHREYPAIHPDSINENLKAYSFIEIDDGYLIIGERINDDGSTDLHLRKINFNGDLSAQKTIIDANDIASLSGRAVALDANKNYIVLASRSGAPPDDMYVAKINATNLAAPPLWDRQYGQGTTTVTNRLFVNSDATLFWAGSVKINEDTDEDMRWIIAAEDAEDALEVNPNPFSGASDETIKDVCHINGRYAVTGSTKTVSGAEKAYFALIGENSSLILGPTTFEYDNKNEAGISVCPAQEGGYVILATAETGTETGLGNGQKDYWLFKVNASGSAIPDWQQVYGGSDDEEAASLIATSDDSYLLFGTTSFGRLKKLMLMKVNAEGKL